MGMWVCFVWEVLIVFVRFFAGFFLFQNFRMYIFFFLSVGMDTI